MRPILLITLSTLVLPFMLLGQEAGKKKDPFVKNPKANSDPNAQRQIGILVEYFKVDHLTANRMVREYAPRAVDAQPLRDELEEMIKAGTAELHETSWVIVRSGNRAQTESVREFIYPTEFYPAEIPSAIGSAATTLTSETQTKTDEKEEVTKTSQSDSASGELPAIHMTPPMPTAFEVRHIGNHMEVDPVLSNDNKTIDLNLAPELTIRLEDLQMAREGFEDTAKGLEHVFMPLFYTIKNTTKIVVIDGRYNLFGINNLPDDPDSRLITMLRVDVIVVQ